MPETVEQTTAQQPPVQQQPPAVDPTPAPQITPDVIKQKAQKGYQNLIAKGISPERAKEVTEKYYNGEIQAYKTRQQPVEQPVKQKSNDGVLMEGVKSLYNGLVPSLLKAPTSIASLATNAVGLHSDTLDDIDKSVDAWVDKNATAYIDPEHNKGIFETDENGDTHLTNMRSLINGTAYGIGMVGQFVGLAALTGGTGDVAEAANGVREATELGDAAGLSKATEAYKAATSKLVMTKAATGSLLFTPQIYKEGQKAGLSNADAARLSLALGPILGMIGAAGPEPEVLEKYLAGELPGAEGAVVNNDLKESILQGVDGWTKGAKMSEADFAATIKSTTKSFSSLTKRLINGQTAKIAGKEFGQMYLQSAVQKFGEQMYDTMYGGDKEVGKGKFGAEEIVKDDSGKGIGPSIFGYQLGKKEALEDVQNGIYGAVIGMGMGMFNTPMVNQSLYGYLDGKIRAGKGEEGIGKAKKMADVLLSKKKITPEQHEALVGTPAIDGKPAADGQPEVPPVPAKKGLIDQMADASNMVKDANGKIDPTASYDVYNYQNNEKPKVEGAIHEFSHPANPDPQANDAGGLVQQLTALKQSDPNNTTAIAALQTKVADGYDAYVNNIHKHEAINKHITDTIATGKYKNIKPELAEIDKGKDHAYTPEIAPLMEGFDREVRVKAKEGKVEDENGVRYKDLVGESGVVHKPSGRKGTIVSRDNSLPGEEPQSEHYFQPHHTEKNQEAVPIEDANEVVDRSKYDHNLTSPKTETDAVQKSSTEGVDVRQQAKNGEGVAERNTEEKTPEARQAQKAVDLDSLKGKPVTYRGQKGRLSIDEGGKVSFKSESGKTYDIPTESNNRNATDYGITPINETAEKRTTVSDVSETGATVNGTKYTIHTDEKGNIVGLSPENKPDQIIKNEKLITAVEIERNKMEYTPLSELSEPELQAKIDEAVKPLSEIDKKAETAIQAIQTQHMNTPTARAIDMLYEDEPITPKQQAQISAWSQKVEKSLRGMAVDDEEMSKSPIFQEAIENLDFINKIAKENVSKNNSPEVSSTEGEQGNESATEAKPVEPTAEETRAETVEQELEKAIAEKPILEEEQQKNSEVAETVINEVAEKDTAVYDALEQGTDVKIDKKVAKEKKAKAEKEPKSKGKKIGKKERNKLILAEPKDYKQAAMQRILGLSELGETLDIDKEAKSEADFWNSNNPKKVTEEQMKQALMDAEKMGADESAQKLKEALNTDTDLETLTKQTIC